MDGGVGDGYSSSTTENDVVYKKGARPQKEEEDKDDDGDEDGEEDEEDEEEEEEEEEVEEEEEEAEDVEEAEEASEGYKRALRSGISTRSRNQSEEPPSPRTAVVPREGGGDAHLFCDNLLPQPPAGEPTIVENSARCRRYKLNSADGDESLSLAAAIVAGGDRNNKSKDNREAED